MSPEATGSRIVPDASEAHRSYAAQRREQRRESVAHLDTGEPQSRLCRAGGLLVTTGPPSASRQGERDIHKGRRTPLGIGCRKQGGQPRDEPPRPFGDIGDPPSRTVILTRLRYRSRLRNRSRHVLRLPTGRLDSPVRIGRARGRCPLQDQRNTRLSSVISTLFHARILSLPDDLFVCTLFSAALL